MKVDREMRFVEPTHPVVSQTVAPDGRTIVTISGTAEQAEKVRVGYRRKGTRLEPCGEQDPPSTEIECILDPFSVYWGQHLTAIAKFAANYSFSVVGRTAITTALASQAYRLLDGSGDPTSFIVPLIDLDLLNKLQVGPSAHTILLAPGAQSGPWAVVVVLFGMLPFAVKAENCDARLHLSKCHTFPIDKNRPASVEVGIVGQVELRTDLYFDIDLQTRNKRIRIIRDNLLEHMAQAAQDRLGLDVAPKLTSPSKD